MNTQFPHRTLGIFMCRMIRHGYFVMWLIFVNTNTRSYFRANDFVGYPEGAD